MHEMGFGCMTLAAYEWEEFACGDVCPYVCKKQGKARMIPTHDNNGIRVVNLYLSLFKD